MCLPLALYVLVIKLRFVNTISSRNKTGTLSAFACLSFFRTASSYWSKFLTVDSGSSFATLISLRRIPFARYSLRSFDAETFLLGYLRWNKMTLSFIVNPAHNLRVFGQRRKSSWILSRIRSCRDFWQRKMEKSKNLKNLLFCSFLWVIKPSNRCGTLCCNSC